MLLKGRVKVFSKFCMVFWRCFLWMISPTPQWSARGCGAGRVTQCQSDTFARVLCSDTRLSLALLEQTWLWLCASLLGIIYFSVKYFINPVTLPFGRASLHCLFAGLWQRQPDAGLGDFRSSTPNCHLASVKEASVPGKRKEMCAWSSLQLGTGQVISHPDIMRSTSSA